MAQRISKSYLMRVLSYPEKPPEIDFSKYRSDITNKDVVQKLEAAYKSVSVPYPKDSRTAEIDAEEQQSKRDFELLKEISNDKIRQAEEIKLKFEVMIPYHEMTKEDFAETFPWWDPASMARTYPTVEPHEALAPGVHRNERDELNKPPGRPWSTFDP